MVDMTISMDSKAARAAMLIDFIGILEDSETKTIIEHAIDLQRVLDASSIEELVVQLDLAGDPLSSIDCAFLSLAFGLVDEYGHPMFNASMLVDIVMKSSLFDKAIIDGTIEDALARVELIDNKSFTYLKEWSKAILEFVITPKKQSLAKSK